MIPINTNSANVLELELSFCENFDSLYRVSACPQWRLITRAGHRSEIQPHLAAALIAGRDACFIAHGYTVDYANVRRSYGTVRHKLQIPTEWYTLDGSPPARIVKASEEAYQVWIYLIWPAHLKPGFWSATGDAAESGEMLGTVLDSLRPRSITLAGHSLGCYMISVAAERTTAPIGLIVLMAPAMDDETPQSKFAKAFTRAGVVLCCHSRADTVLGRWYRWFGSRVWNLFGFRDHALGFSGPQDPDRVPISFITMDGTDAKVDHSGWKVYPPLYTKWMELIHGS